MALSLEKHSEKQMQVQKLVNPSISIEVNFLANPMHFHQLTEIFKE
jgi:hypothetical protein